MNQLAKTAVKGYLLKNPLTWIVIAIVFFFSALVFTVAIFLMSISSIQQEEEVAPQIIEGGMVGGIGGTAKVTPEVMRYKPIIEKYAAQYGVSEHVELLLAKMMQESGGRGLDPMQASESMGKPIGFIKDPEFSIDMGIKHFSNVLKKANGDVLLAVQSYNYGGGYINYVQERGGRHTKELAWSFSEAQVKKMGRKISRIAPGYGDSQYVSRVLRYLPGYGTQTANAQAPVNVQGPTNANGFAKPIAANMRATSNFGMRLHPIKREYRMHWGTDFSCNRQEIPIFAAKDGTVIESGSNGTAGNFIRLQHEGNVQTRYLHLSKKSVSQGETVKQGQTIGNCGSTGSSTAEHLHFEMKIGDQPVNPLDHL